MMMMMIIIIITTTVMYREKDIQHQTHDYTGNNWNHRNSKQRLKRNLEAVPGKHSIDSLQKTSILGTSHITRKVLQCETWSPSGGDRRWFKRKYQGEKACDKRQRNGNSVELIFINVTCQQPDGQLQKQHNMGAQTTKTTKQDTCETNIIIIIIIKEA